MFIHLRETKPWILGLRECILQTSPLKTEIKILWNKTKINYLKYLNKNTQIGPIHRNTTPPITHIFTLHDFFAALRQHMSEFLPQKARQALSFDRILPCNNALPLKSMFTCWKCTAWFNLIHWLQWHQSSLHCCVLNVFAFVVIYILFKNPSACPHPMWSLIKNTQPWL